MDEIPHGVSTHHMRLLNLFLFFSKANQRNRLACMVAPHEQHEEGSVFLFASRCMFL